MSRRVVPKKRQPAYRTKPPQWYEKPIIIAKDAWQRWQAMSLKKRLGIIGGITAAFLIIVPVASYLYFVRDINDRERLMNRNNTGIVIMDRHDEVVYSFGKSGSDKFYELDEIAEDVPLALIASEDRTFYEHGGFSIRSIFGAFVGNLLNLDMTRYGGSTITQQLVKNNLLSERKSYFRKYQEVSIAMAIERRYEKEEILELYLNSVYYGEGAFGIEQAADTYFEKKPNELTLAESTMLIGLLPAPSAYSPISGDFELTKEQQERVLTAMAAEEFITEEAVEQTLAQELAFASVERQRQEFAHHFTEMIIEELNRQYGEEQVARSGFRVRSTIDLAQQEFAEKTVSEAVERNQSQGATNASLVAIDPNNGEVIALVGSADWDNEAFGQVNMATTPRQPGSSFKPIYYAEALDKRLITPATIIRDERKTYGDYSPENFDMRFRGDVTVRYALATSLNIPAIEVLQKLGVAEGAEAAGRMGITTVTEPEVYGLSLALGTAETSVYEMTNAYAAFANLGVQHKPKLILAIENKFGDEISTRPIDATRVQSAEASYIVSSILADERARAATFGNRLNIPNRQVAVKTGTTNDNIDAWTVGYTPSISVGVWVGDNEHKPMQLGGAAAAGPIWSSVLQNILQGRAPETFPRPGEVSQIYVCTINGAYDEYFFAGYEPPERCDRPTPQAPAPIRDEPEEEPEEPEEPDEPEEEPEEPEEPDEPEEEPEEPEEENGGPIITTPILGNL